LKARSAKDLYRALDQPRIMSGQEAVTS